MHWSLSTIGITAVVFGACSTSGGSGTGTLSGYLDRLGPAYCDWLIGCGKATSADRSTCLADFNKESAAVRSCAPAQTFYDQHSGALEACLSAKPACGNDDVDTFCAELAKFDAASCTSSGDGGTSGSDGGGSSAGSCAWHGNCSTRAPNGAYDCSGNSLMKCVDGSWVSVVGCTSTHDSKGYACTCKGGCGTSKVECSYAFNTCEGHSYPTCGPSSAVISSPSWHCE